MQRVQSHVLEAVGYDESAHLLRARYRDSGEIVIYEGVPQEVYDELIFADSIGSFFREQIEPRFPRRRN